MHQDICSQSDDTQKPKSNFDATSDDNFLVQ